MTDLGTAMDPRVLLVTMLIGLGVTTYEKFKTYVEQNGDDDASLAGILTEVDVRLARRGVPPDA